MLLRSLVVAVLFLASAAIAAPASAQRFPFERSYAVGDAPTIDITTIRGKINVRVGEPGRVLVSGAATVRVAWDSPFNAVDLARKVAEHPPIEKTDTGLRLRPPSDAAGQRATTVNYDLRVPRGARIVAISDSGAIDVRDVAGHVEARTQSSAIAMADLGGTADIDTGSGAVTVDRAEGIVRVSTSTSAITARSLRGGLQARTASGHVSGSFAGQGPVDVRTKSSGIDLLGVSGSLTTFTESGHTMVTGVPSAAWDLSSGSSGIDIGFESAVHATLMATTGSGTVTAPERLLTGFREKGRIEGAIGKGGPAVRVSSRSGSIRIR